MVRRGVAALLGERRVPGRRGCHGRRRAGGWERWPCCVSCAMFVCCP